MESIKHRRGATKTKLKREGKTMDNLDFNPEELVQSEETPAQNLTKEQELEKKMAELRKKFDEETRKIDEQKAKAAEADAVKLGKLRDKIVKKHEQKKKAIEAATKANARVQALDEEFNKFVAEYNDFKAKITAE